MFTHSEKIGALGEALSKAQSEVEGASKDSANPHFRSKYASLAAVIEACRAALSKNGIAVVQAPSAKGPEVTVSTILMHASGEWIEASLTASARDASPQSVGSAVTYLRRYGLMSMVGIAPEDDDGEEAQPPRREQPNHHLQHSGMGAQERSTHPQRPQDTRGQATRDGGRVSDGNAKAGETKPAWSSTPEGQAFAEVAHLLMQVWPGAEGQKERIHWWWQRYAPNSRAEMPADWTPMNAWGQSDDKRKAKILETAKSLVESETHPDDRSKA